MMIYRKCENVGHRNLINYIFIGQSNFREIVRVS